MIKRCLKCDKVLEIMAGAKRLNPKRKYCDRICGTRYIALEFYNKHKRDPGFQEEKYKRVKIWIGKNRKRHSDNVLKNYKENKGAWRERKWTDKNRKKILLILSDNCNLCNNPSVKVIHHETYDLPKRERNPLPVTEEYLQEYCRHLLGFCSTKCHLKYHRILRDQKL